MHAGRHPASDHPARFQRSDRQYHLRQRTALRVERRDLHRGRHADGHHRCRRRLRLRGDDGAHGQHSGAPRLHR